MFSTDCSKFTGCISHLLGERDGGGRMRRAPGFHCPAGQQENHNEPEHHLFLFCEKIHPANIPPSADFQRKFLTPDLAGARDKHLHPGPRRLTIPASNASMRRGGNRRNTRYTATLPMRNGAFQPATHPLQAATRVRPRPVADMTTPLPALRRGETGVTPATPLHYL